MKSKRLITAIATALLLGCSPSPLASKDQKVDTASEASESSPSGFVKKAPVWTKDAVIYQINTRQYSESGQFAAVEADLDRIKSLGVDILWFMPIHPIGEAKRKGSLGSPYAVKDFQAVNPELGTLEDFKSLVDAAHSRGMKVIIDWVANHTSWDNALIETNPEWYTRNAKGEFQHPPETDWTDVADLDYSEQGLRNYMIESLLYWVKEVGIDGYRCDVAGMVPTDFWNAVRPELEAVKPVFMLAEWQDPELHEKAFDASYAWRWKEILQDIVKGEATADEIAEYYVNYQDDWPRDAMRMAYTSNHDQNTWDGTPFEIYGEAYEAAIALSFVGEGIPLIYNGQENCNKNRLAFFEKDLIEWNKACPLEALFKKLVALKTKNSALHNGQAGGRLVLIENGNEKNMLSFARRKGSHEIFAIFNLSSVSQNFQVSDARLSGDYKNYFTGETLQIKSGESIDGTLKPWDYRIYVR